MRLGDVDIQNYDFLDFGAGTGGSLSYCAKRFGGRGLGIEIDERKITDADQTGTEVAYGDLFGLPREEAVSYVSMMDFLEHLPDLDAVGNAIEIAMACSRDFVFINHPSFEDEQFLRGLGFKLYWQDWSGHTVHPMLDFLIRKLTQAGASKIELSFRQPIVNTLADAVLPIDAPRNSHSYDPLQHPPKSLLDFPGTLFGQIQITAHKAKA